MKKLKNIILILAISCSSVYMSLAQGVFTTGNVYVHNHSEVGIHGELIFSSNGVGTYSGIIVTNRNSQNPGAVAFGKQANWSYANDAQHVDGFVSVYSNNSFTFPIGNLGYYKPISISGGGFGTAAAYYYDNPLKLASVSNLGTLRASSSEEETTLSVSDSEYWDIRGENATEVTFYWDFNSDIEKLTNGNLSNLTVVGWNGYSWEVISSSVDDFMIDINDSSGSKSTTLKSDNQIGSITTESLVPNDYEVFALAGLNSSGLQNEVVFGSERFLEEKIEMTVFPNPTNNLSDLNIDYDISQIKSNATLHVFDELGEILFSQQLFDKNGIINLPYNQNTSGVYHVGIVTENGSKVFKPVVVTF